MEEKDITYELKIRLQKEAFYYGFADEFCAYLTGAVGTREDDYGGYRYSHGIMEASKYKEEEGGYNFPVRFEYHGYYDEPNYWHHDQLYIYLERPLNEQETDMIQRRAKKFAQEKTFELLSVQTIQKEIVAIETEHQRIL